MTAGMYRMAAVMAALLLVVIGMSAGCGMFETDEEADAVPLKIGLLLNFTGSPEASADRQRAFELALKHVNDAGGVFGMPVTGVVADATGDPDTAVEEAMRLVDEEGVHAIVGPNASSAALPVSRTVSAVSRIPTVSPSATSAWLTDVEDDDYFFRTSLSDVVHGPILADITRERGFDNVGLIYQDDAYGAALAEAFAASWTGKLRSVAVDPAEPDILAAVPESASDGAEVLVVIAFRGLTTDVIKHALDSGGYSQFVLGDAAKRISLVEEIGAEKLAGTNGTGSAHAPHSATTEEWDESYVSVYGELPVLAYVKETYDATIALALGAQAAGSVDGEAIRDQLRSVANTPGRSIPGTPAGIADALAALAAGEQINYEGAAGVLEWDENGDLSRGYIGTWRFTADGRIEDLESIPYEG